MLDKIINKQLLSHPMNWVTVFVMSLVGFLIVDMAILFWQSNVSNNQNS